jgi:hypothetical protein
MTFTVRRSFSRKRLQARDVDLVIVGSPIAFLDSRRPCSFGNRSPHLR